MSDMTPTAAAIDKRGYLIQFPTLSLPDPAGDWVRLNVVIGRKDECFNLLKRSELEGGHLRECALVQKVMEMELDGAVWYLPTVMPLESDSDLEIFQLYVHRLPLSVVPPASRAKLSDGTSYVFMVRVPGEEKSFSDEDLLEKLNASGGDYTLEGLQLLSRCRETTPSQQEPPPPLPAPTSPEEAAERERIREDTLDQARSLWHATTKGCLKEEFKKQLHRDAIAAGLISSTTPFIADRVFAHIRVSPEQDGDVRGLDYALSSGKDDQDSPGDEAEWLPLPPQAAEAKWVRCGANLERYELGKKLFTKAEWPPRPTTLTIRKLAGIGERSRRR